MNGEEILTTQGSYCWRGFIFAQCVDLSYTTPLDMAKEQSPTEVSPQAKVKIEFHKEPIAGTLEIEQWEDKDNIKNIELKDDSFLVPKEKGIYVYHIMSFWEQGDGNYAFSIEVE